MEGEVKIKDEDQNNSIIDKIKSNKNLLIVCGAVAFVFIIFLVFRSNGSGVTTTSSSKTSSTGTKLNHYDFLIVGSGLYGATFNYLAKKAGKTTYVVEKRDVIGGNLYCENIEGIFVHKYGPHVFHTDNKKVWDFVNNLTHFNPYIQQTVANVENKLYSLPFNMWTFYQLWGVTTPEEAQAKIDSQRYKGEVNNGEENVKIYLLLSLKDYPQDLLMMVTILMIDIKVFQKDAIIL